MSDFLGRIISNIRDKNGAAHAYIIEGLNASTRQEYVKEFAKAILCESPTEVFAACGRCASCRTIEARTNMDIVHMAMSGKSGYVTEDASNFIARLGLGAYGSHLIGIIDEGDKLSDIVQNKLLKTLEEPSEGTLIIISTTNADNLLSTVKSRCGSIRLADDGSLESTVDLEKFRTRFFYKYRASVDKNITSNDEALELLSRLEDARRDAMLEGGENMLSCAYAIELIEKAREDICKGMHYGKALKRLFLELSK